MPDMDMGTGIYASALAYARVCSELRSGHYTLASPALPKPRAFARVCSGLRPGHYTSRLANSASMRRLASPRSPSPWPVPAQLASCHPCHVGLPTHVSGIAMDTGMHASAFAYARVCSELRSGHHTTRLARPAIACTTSPHLARSCRRLVHAHPPPYISLSYECRCVGPLGIWEVQCHVEYHW
jgi:hypothetical protein